MNGSPDMPGHRDEPWSFLATAAAALGFAAVGAAPAGPLPAPDVHALGAWLESGQHGSMSYLARHREQRRDPRHPGIVPDADAVICAALPYADGAVGSGLWRHVAAHARGRDYHDTMRARLGGLARAIEQRWPGCRWRCFVDTGPLLERAWAVAAGLGSIGRHSGLIVPGTGARVVLGEIVCAGVPAPPQRTGAPRFEPCEDCALCVEACPTSAIADSGTVDARRCLSYHSIESRADRLPAEIGAALRLIFGCDECTAACPLEDRTTRCGLEPPPDPGPSDMDPESLIAGGDREIAPLIRGTCLERAGIEGLRRNARYAIDRGRIARKGVS